MITHGLFWTVTFVKTKLYHTVNLKKLLTYDQALLPAPLPFLYYVFSSLVFLRVKEALFVAESTKFG